MTSQSAVGGIAYLPSLVSPPLHQPERLQMASGSASIAHFDLWCSPAPDPSHLDFGSHASLKAVLGASWEACVPTLDSQNLWVSDCEWLFSVEDSLTPVSSSEGLRPRPPPPELGPWCFWVSLATAATSSSCVCLSAQLCPTLQHHGPHGL